jgi:hypothetical protein
VRLFLPGRLPRYSVSGVCASGHKETWPHDPRKKEAASGGDLNGWTVGFALPIRFNSDAPLRLRHGSHRSGFR